MEGPDTDPLLLGLAAGHQRAFIALYDRYGRRLYRAAGKPGCYFDRDYERPNFGVLPSQLLMLRRAARLLALDARLRAAQGDTAAALASINAIFVIAEHTTTDPVLIALLLSTGIDALAAQTLQEVLASGTASATELSSVNIGQWVCYRRQLDRAFRMEEAFGQAIFCEMGTQVELTWVDDDFRRRIGPLTPLYRVFLLGDDLATYRRIMAQVRQLSAKPYYQAKSGLEDLVDQMRAGPRGVLTNAIVPALARCSEFAARGDARRRVARVALAMHRYRAEHDRFPQSPGELAPEFISFLPTDPFDGKPLKLKPTEKGLVVYSVGPDMTDNGGLPFDKEEETGDIAFELIRQVDNP